VPEEQHKCGRIAHIGTFEVDRQGKESKKGNATCRKKKKKETDIYTYTIQM
jgi:hypothetical protein